MTEEKLETIDNLDERFTAHTRAMSAMMSDLSDVIKSLRDELADKTAENIRLKTQLDAVSEQMTAMTQTLQNSYDNLHGHVQQAPEIQALFSRADQSIEQVENRLYTDELTGLKNRVFLNHVIRNASPSTWGCLSLDLDHFKAINDQYGHQTGDGILRAVSDIVKRCNSSEAGTNHRVYAVRTGGEEEIIMCQLRSGDRSDPQAEAAFLRNSLSAIAHEGHPFGFPRR